MPYGDRSPGAHAHRSHRGGRRGRLRRWGMLTLLMLPLFLALGAPVATVLLPGALLTAAALPASDLFAHDTIRNDVLLPEIVDSHDPREASRIASAQFIGRVDLT